MKGFPSMPECVVDVRSLSFGYEKTPILEGVNLKIFERQFVGIFGPNGGGKTTFLKILMGFLKPSLGEVLIFGQPPKLARTRMGYVPQAAGFDKQFPISVLELVLMGCLSRLRWWGGYPKEALERAERSLERVGLLDKKDKPFGTLSGGQAQRALIARALASDPQLLLLDEPTASVDPVAEQEIYRLLDTLKQEITILMVSHDLQTIVGKAERLLCIHKQVTAYAPHEVCGHFTIGLYHPPLKSP